MIQPIVYLALYSAAVLADGSAIYKDAAQPIPARVAALLQEMTLPEMIAQLLHRDDVGESYVMANYSTVGFGEVSIRTMIGATPIATVRARNRFQAAIMNSSRLHLPIAFSQEALHSGAYFGTIFPGSVATGGSWNDSLPFLIGTAIGEEARASGVNVAYAPVAQLWTDDRFGRFSESFSPDPTITAHMSRAMMLGLQGGPDIGAPDTYLPNFNTTLISVAKHFAGYGGAVGGLNGAPNAFDNRTIHEQYLKPWRGMAALGLRGAMVAHQPVLGVPGHANTWLLNATFRNEFGAGGAFLISDENDIGKSSWRCPKASYT